jgi:hypothetical protein
MDHHHIHVLNWKQQIQKWDSKEQEQKPKTPIRPTNAATTIYQLQPRSASDHHRPTEQIPPV